MAHGRGRGCRVRVRSRIELSGVVDDEDDLQVARLNARLPSSCYDAPKPALDAS